MRILLVTDCFFPETNGISFYVEKLAQELGVLKQTVKIWAPNYGGEIKEKDSLNMERFASVRVPLDTKTQLVWPRWQEVGEKLEKGKPDVIHVHTLGALGVVTLLEAKKRRIPVVVTYHTLIGSTLVSYPLMKLMSRGVKALAEKYTQWVCNKATLVMALSPAVAEYLRSTGVNTKQVLVPNGVETKLFVPKEVGKKYEFIFVGRIGFEKGIEVLIGAMKILREKKIKAKLLIVGSGPAEEKLKKMVKEEGLENLVEFIANVPHQQLPEIYNLAKVFVSASQFEVNPTVVWEALACGLPVVAAHKGGLAAGWIENGKQGYLVEEITAVQYAKYLEKMIAEEKELKAMASSARRLAETNSVEEMTKKIMKVYDLSLGETKNEKNGGDSSEKDD